MAAKYFDGPEMTGDGRHAWLCIAPLKAGQLGTSSSSPTSPPVPSRTGPNPDQVSAGEAYCLVCGREIHVNSVCLALGRDRPSVSQIFHVGGHALEW